jgi:hypothetical protein
MKKSEEVLTGELDGQDEGHAPDASGLATGAAEARRGSAMARRKLKTCILV